MPKSLIKPPGRNGHGAVSFMDKNSSLLEEILSKDPGMTVMMMKKKLGTTGSCTLHNQDTPKLRYYDSRYSEIRASEQMSPQFFIPYTVSI